MAPPPRLPSPPASYGNLVYKRHEFVHAAQDQGRDGLAWLRHVHRKEVARSEQRRSVE